MTVTSQQINLRLEPELVAALERIAREESLDRGTVVRRLLESSLAEWHVERALRRYQSGEVSLGRASEEAGLTHWELLEAARARGIAYPLREGELAERLSSLADVRTGEQERPGTPSRAGDGRASEEASTLPDRQPQPGGVLLVGINPAPASVAAAHYYQGRLGKRLWRRLEQVGLLVDTVRGAEDDAFARAGHGLTDLVKRPTRSANELSKEELRAGIDDLRSKVRRWRPGLVLFPFKLAAALVLEDPHLRPGAGLPFEAVPTFLLSGPYAAREEADRVDAELRDALESVTALPSDSALSQQVTKADLEAGIIRLPRTAKRFFPSAPTNVDVVLRGARAVGRYNPRTGPDRDRSAVLRLVGVELKQLIRPDEKLRVTRGLGGIVLLD